LIGRGIRSFARKEGLKEGKVLGLKEGQKQGLQKGKALGLKEGQKQGRQEVAKKLLKTSLTEQQIADITGVPLEKIKELQNSDNQFTQ
jgi:predicted transposase YdaD